MTWTHWQLITLEGGEGRKERHKRSTRESSQLTMSENVGARFRVWFLMQVSGRFAYGSFRLRLESIRLRLICQFAYESDVEALTRN